METTHHTPLAVATPGDHITIYTTNGGRLTGTVEWETTTQIKLNSGPLPISVFRITHREWGS